MNVCVDQTGKKRGVAEVDGFGSGGMVYGGPGGGDLVALDEYLAGCDHLPGFDVEQAGGVEDGGVRLRGRDGGDQEGEGGEFHRLWGVG